MFSLCFYVYLKLKNSKVITELNNANNNCEWIYNTQFYTFIYIYTHFKSNSESLFMCPKITEENQDIIG